MTQAAQAPVATTTTRRRSFNFLLYLSLIPGFLLLALASALAGFQVRHAPHIYPGVGLAIQSQTGILFVDLGGLTQPEAEALLTPILVPYPGKAVTLRYGEQQWSAPASDLGVGVDVRRTVQRAFALGRGGTFWQDLNAQYRLYRSGVEIEPVLLYDEGQELYILSRIAREINRPAQEGVLRLEGTEVIAQSGAAGRELDIEASQSALRVQLVRGDNEPVDLVVRPVHPVVEQVEPAASQAREILSKSLELDFKEGDQIFSFAITPEILVGWISYRQMVNAAGDVEMSAALDEAKIRQYVDKEIAPHVVREPKNASFAFDTNAWRLVPVDASQDGLELNADLTIQRIMAVFQGGEPKVELAVNYIKPEIATEDADKLGITDLVAKGTTTFKGSSTARAQNIIAAAGKFRNVLIPPGGIFSFNEHLGGVTEDNGFVEGLVIWGDRTAVGIGGGVCQVSTTAFRAAFYGGFPIVERWAHGYVVSWYGDPGYDATIYEPQVDFRFRNDTDAYLLINTTVDEAAGTVTFSFYGKPTGRTVEVSEYEVDNVRDAPPAIYQEDTSLKPGEQKQVEWAKRGMDVTVKRQVKVDGQVVREDTFVSKYQPWPSMYLVGPSQSPANTQSNSGT